MLYPRKESKALEVFAYVVMFTLIFGLAFLVNYFSCSLNWGSSGMDVRWRPFAGCQLEKEQGKWFPAETFRVN